MDIVCSGCKKKLILPEDKIPQSKSFTFTCPECKMTLSITIPEKFYSCSGCKKIFESVKERIDHGKQCPLLKEREFNCNSCKKDFTLDDSEFKEFKTKGQFMVECPSCKKITVLKK